MTRITSSSSLLEPAIPNMTIPPPPHISDPLENINTSNMKLELLFDMITDATQSKSPVSEETLTLACSDTNGSDVEMKTNEKNSSGLLNTITPLSTQPIISASLEQQLNVNTNINSTNETINSMTSSSSVANVNSNNSSTSSHSSNTSSITGANNSNANSINNDNSDDNIDLSLLNSVHACAAQVRRLFTKKTLKKIT